MNDCETWEDWIAQHGPQMVLFARRWAVDHADAEDLVQESLVRFWRTKAEADDPLAYLYRTLRSVAVDSARSRKSRDQRESLRARSHGESFETNGAVESEERRQRLEHAVAELLLEQAEMVTLKIWSELAFAQIAEVTGDPIGTVTSRYRYALNRLRERLAQVEER